PGETTPPPASSPPDGTRQGTGTGAAKVPADFAGTWTGTVTQTGGLTSGESSTKATIKLEEGATDGTSDYDDWGCHNTLVVEESSATTLRFQETPKNSRGTQGVCVGGTLTLERVGDGLKYSSPGGLGTTTTGVLHVAG
ncbi:hypothetical protein, partial [Actinomadura sp. 7K507]|uniref:hypothetical protein n=1 Tax=Actinomadura sp. 7K507 TaxID=2530365 RepID=UPI001A9FB273